MLAADPENKLKEAAVTHNETRTYLDTSDGMGYYAKQHGALFDRDQLKWYVEGEVSTELLGLLPKEKRLRKVHVIAPLCPICSFHTIRKTNHIDGSLFWGCSQFSITNCKGSVDYEDYLNAQGIQTAISAADALTQSSNSTRALAPDVTTIENLDLLNKRKLIVQLVIENFGHVDGEKWLSLPKVGLNAKTPISLMKDLDGCETVLKLIRRLQ